MTAPHDIPPVSDPVVLRRRTEAAEDADWRKALELIRIRGELSRLAGELAALCDSIDAHPY
jgi:hypothetical protein